MHVYDPGAMAWTNLSAASHGTPPSPRAYHGFTAAAGRLYVHGGANDIGNRPFAIYSPQGLGDVTASRFRVAVIAGVAFDTGLNLNKPVKFFRENSIFWVVARWSSFRTYLYDIITK